MNKLAKMFAPTNIFECLKIIKYITFLNGLLPFKMTEDGKSFRLSKLSMAIAFLHYTFFAVSFTASWKDDYKLKADLLESNVIQYISMIRRVTSFSCITCLFAISLFRRIHLKRMLELFLEIDQLSKRMSIKLNYQRIQKLILLMAFVILGFKILFSVTYFMIFEKNWKSSIFLEIVFTLPSLYKWNFILLYIALVYILRVFLKSINQVYFNFTLITFLL